MTNISMKSPPLLGVIPPDESLDTAVIRLAFYDDDGKPAEMTAALEAGLQAYATIPTEVPLPGPQLIIAPVRDAIFTSLNAAKDDILIDHDIVIRRGAALPFNSGMVGSVMNSFIRVYYFVKDENRTETFGPVSLHKGQTETIRFEQKIQVGGRIAIFSRGSDVNCSAFGELTADTPFQNRMIARNQETAFQDGFSVTASGPAKLVAYYTPPEPK